MYFSNILLCGILSLSVGAFAGKFMLSTKFPGGGNFGERRSTRALTLPDDKDALILNGIKGWSNGKFEAVTSKRAGHIIVRDVKAAASEKDAKDEIEEIIKLIIDNTKDTPVGVAAKVGETVAGDVAKVICELRLSSKRTLCALLICLGILLAADQPEHMDLVGNGCV